MEVFLSGLVNSGSSVAIDLLLSLRVLVCDRLNVVLVAIVCLGTEIGGCRRSTVNPLSSAEILFDERRPLSQEILKPSGTMRGLVTRMCGSVEVSITIACCCRFRVLKPQDVLHQYTQDSGVRLDTWQAIKHVHRCVIGEFKTGGRKY
jgi:hypothetical protein